MAANFLTERVRWRHLNLDSVALTGYPLLVLAAWWLPDWRGVLAALGLLAAAAFYAWLRAYRRYRFIADTPTARLASAAQGHVELHGRTEVPGGGSGIGFAWTPPAVWLRYRVYRRSGERWGLVERGQSASVFVLDDGSGRCLVDPEGAEVYTSRRFRRQQGDFLYCGEYIAPGDELYALGRLRTEGGNIDPGDARSDVASLLATWKRDRPFLLGRFDRNRDGEIDLEEWERVRAAAQANVRARRRARDYDPVTHRLGHAEGWRPYLLSVLPERRIAGRYRAWAAVHLLVFAVAGTLTATLALQPAPAPGPELAVRAVFISAPPQVAIRVAGHAFGPTAAGGERAFYRSTLPIGERRFELRYPDGSALARAVVVPPGDRLLLITVGERPAVPIGVR